MLTEDEIRQTLHADRVVSLGVANPHGPLGLEQLAETVQRLPPTSPAHGPHVRRYLDLPGETWAKLDQLAAAASQTAARPVSPSEVAATLLQESLAGR